jgi:DNA-binding transcriptional LysR family regulator
MAGAPADMGIFVRVAERGSFARAAEDVGVSASAVAKLITRLEDRLGVRLITRTTRKLALTAEGEVYLGRAREILAAIETAESELASTRACPRGHLRVHAYPVIAEHYIAPALPAFLDSHPQVQFEFIVTNRIVDLIDENIDISVRMGPFPDSRLVVRKILDLRRIVCASPAYIARRGRPTRPSDLLDYSCLTLSRNPGSAAWLFYTNGERTVVHVKGPVSADSADMLLRLAIEGAGVLRLSEHVVAPSISAGLLEPLLEDAQDPETYPLCALMAPGRHQTPKVRAFLEFLVEHLGRSHGETSRATAQRGRTATASSS